MTLWSCSTPNLPITAADPEPRLSQWRRLPLHRAVASNPYRTSDQTGPSDVGNDCAGLHDLANTFFYGTQQTVPAAGAPPNDQASPPTADTPVLVVDAILGLEKLLVPDPSYAITGQDDPLLLQGIQELAVGHDYRLALAILLNSFRLYDFSESRARAIVAALLCINARAAALKVTNQVRHYAIQNNNSGMAADWSERCGLQLAALLALDPAAGRTVASQIGSDPHRFFKAAKTYYAASGDSDGRSRSAVLEIDAAAESDCNAFRSAMRRLSRWLWLYGESPRYAFRSMALVWSLCAIVYLFGGFATGTKQVAYDAALAFPNRDIAADFLSALYFSAVTMTTLGYGDCWPTGAFSKVLAGLQAFMGLVLAAMLIATIQKRYAS